MAALGGPLVSERRGHSPIAEVDAPDGLVLLVDGCLTVTFLGPVVTLLGPMVTLLGPMVAFVGPVVACVAVRVDLSVLGPRSGEEAARVRGDSHERAASSRWCLCHFGRKTARAKGPIRE
jgi:hypothetical protein